MSLASVGGRMCDRMLIEGIQITSASEVSNEQKGFMEGHG